MAATRSCNNKSNRHAKLKYSCPFSDHLRSVQASLRVSCFHLLTVTGKHKKQGYINSKENNL